MRIANASGRLTLLDANGVGLDVAMASDGRFSADPQQVFAQWDEFRDWAAKMDGRADLPVAEDELGPPTPSPRQVFGIGLNYGAHAEEARLGRPDTMPPTFTKFPTCITGPRSDVVLPSGNVDWEVELVVVIGRRAEHVDEDAAYDHVAGLMVGQDLSERVVQLTGPAPQFSLGKSFPGFGPVGPAVVTLDEAGDPDDLELGCSLDGEQLQLGRTSDMIFNVRELVARLSSVLPLMPGDVIFTGTPSGVGVARDPQRFLPIGGLLVSHIQGLGELRNRLVAPADVATAR